MILTMRHPHGPVGRYYPNSVAGCDRHDAGTGVEQLRPLMVVGFEDVPGRHFGNAPGHHSGDGIQGAFTDGFKSIFDGGVDTFKDLASTVKGIVTRLAAEMATLLIFRPVIGPAIGAPAGSVLRVSGTP